MKLSVSTLLLFQSLMWLAMAGDYKQYAASSTETFQYWMESREKAINSAAIFHDLWLSASGLA